MFVLPSTFQIAFCGLLLLCAPGYGKKDEGDARFKLDDAGRREYLASKDGLENEERQFDGKATLGYVTPWNNHGYDVAKFAAKKFTHISPVWFQFTELADGGLDCEITGTHDLDKGWMSDVRKHNPNVQIVPRFLFENWKNSLQSFLSNEDHNYQCGQTIVNFLLENEMDGAVMEMWLQMLIAARGQGANHMLGIVQSWARLFQSHGLTFILPLPSPIGENNQIYGIATREMLEELLEHVDYLSVMNYDYPSEKPAAVGPINWIENNLKYILNSGSSRHAHKVLLGTNFYGYTYNPNRTAMLSRDLKKLLETSSSLAFEWDREAAEHVIRKGSKVVAYLPTKRSIQARLALAEDLGCGLAIWEIGQGLDDFMTIL